MDAVLALFLALAATHPSDAPAPDNRDSHAWCERVEAEDRRVRCERMDRQHSGSQVRQTVQLNPAFFHGSQAGGVERPAPVFIQRGRAVIIVRTDGTRVRSAARAASAAQATASVRVNH